MGELWKDWTPEQWANAVFCPDCGLPMFEVPFEEQQHSSQEHEISSGTYQCVYCTWTQDETAIQNGLKTQIKRLEHDKSHFIQSIIDLNTIIDLLKEKYGHTHQNPKV